MGFVAIFGGTFNPLHIGHYEMLRALQKDPDIDEIWIMPDRIPPHKECDFLASDNDRIEMCRIASCDFSKAKLCLVEFEREGKSYTYDTVVFLRKKYPQKNFLFVLGTFLIRFSQISLRLSPRPISIGQLHTLLHFHLRPINLVVFKGSYYLTIWDILS